ncbi:4-hydroxy-tetrahydrodipicolinate synthase [Exiguobacterium sp. s193]|uniref:4-hydroxy-tetrahydrodipicolinate synthase n=1 Tax=Exiguobacterium sp. s193 TaxID=2751207 RepID=UPI001BEB6436|nr:4-hydroxy-tetrahydrodipicolinate synthase [Exiguobacterium sp. s193]
MFKGAGTALATPFNTAGELDLVVFEQLIEQQLAANIQALVVAGTTGEGSTLSSEEFETLLETAVRVTAGRVPVIAGTGTNNTAQTIEKTKTAQRLGADAAMLVTPYYNKTSQAGLVAHFTAVADAVELPIMLYNVPSRTGVAIAVETAVTLAKHPNIQAFKEASGDVSFMGELMTALPDGFAVYCGNDDQILPYMAWGAQGVISVLSNPYPAETQALAEAMLANDLTTARRIQSDLMSVIAAIFSDVNPIPVKAALEELGFAVGAPRLPLVRQSEAGHAHLLETMHAYKGVVR